METFLGLPGPHGSLEHELVVFKTRCFGGSSQEQVLKGGVHNVGLKPSALQGEALGLGSLPIVPIVGWGLHNKMVFQPFLPTLMWFFSHVPSRKELFC